MIKNTIRTPFFVSEMARPTDNQLQTPAKTKQPVKNSAEWIRCIHLGQQLEQSGRTDLAETFYKRAVQLACGTECRLD